MTYAHGWLETSDYGLQHWPAAYLRQLLTSILDAGTQVFRGALPQPDWTRRRHVPYTAPRNSLEIEVQLIWQAVIGLNKPISIHEDFSGVGGNMLHAVIINAIFRQAYSSQTTLVAGCCE